jgi:hypothetical protein
MKDDLDYYLTQDHAARQRTMLFSVFAGAVAGATAQLVGVSTNRAFEICVVIVAAFELGRALGYQRASQEKRTRTAVVLPLRRYAIRVAFSAFVVFILALLRIPHIEAAVIDRKLRKMTEEDPFPFEKVDALINLAIQNSIRIPEKSIAAAKRQALRAAVLNTKVPSASPASATLAHLEAYTLYDVAALRLRLSIVIFLPARTYVIYGPIHSPSSSNLGESRDGVILDVEFKSTDVVFKHTNEMPAVMSYPEMRSDALIARMTARGQSLAAVADAPEFVRKAPGDESYKLAVLDLTISNLRQTVDGLIWIDVLFDHCLITYQGGPIQLERVIFRDCNLSASTQAGAKVLDYIRSQGDKPVTLRAGQT